MNLTEKPPIRMKTVVKIMEGCIIECDCRGCPFVKAVNCQERLMAAGLWYLKQTISKSEKGRKNVSALH